MSSNGSKKNPFPRLGSWEGSWEVGRRTKDVDECEKCQNNTHIAEISEKINFYSNRSRKEKWICREASGLLSVNKNEKNTAEHLIIYKLTSGPIYTYVLYYTNIDRLGNQGRVGGVGPRSKKILPIKYFSSISFLRSFLKYTNIIIVIIWNGLFATRLTPGRKKKRRTRKGEIVVRHGQWSQ